MGRYYDIFVRFTLPIFFGLAISACNGGQYQFQVFTFPSGNPPHESDWEYKAVIKVSTDDSGSMFRRGDKIVQIRILDKRDQEYLNQEYSLSSVANVTASVEWVQFESLNVELLESGSGDVGDSYSAVLAESGPRVIESLHYEFNQQKNKYEIVIERE